MSWDDCRELRVPVSDRWLYIADIEASATWNATEPDRDEVELIRSYIEYVCGPGFYGMDFDRFVERWTPDGAKPYVLISGHNTVSFLRRSREDWAYRRHTWTRRHYWAPGYDQPKQTLLELLDRINTVVDHLYQPWVDWKAAHPELFAEVPA